MQKLTTLIGAVLLSGLATTSHAQRLTAAGVSGSFNVARLHTGQGAFSLGAATINPQADLNNDETGNGITVFGRWQLGARPGWYVQPELGYTSTLATPVGITYSQGNFIYASNKVRHLDARLLGGYQAGPLRLFAGPVLGYFLYQTTNHNYSAPDLQEAANALDTRPTRVQAAIQAGAGVSVWRLDINARYEWGLTPYSRMFESAGRKYTFNRNLQQLILEIGFRIYNNPTAE